MKRHQLKEIIKSEIIKTLEENKSFSSPGVGDNVEIPSDLTSDPINKQGKKGEVKFIDDMGMLYVMFSDGLVGAYQPEVFEKEITEVSDEELEKQREFNKELERTQELSSGLSEDVDDDDAEPKSSEIKDDAITNISKKLGDTKKEMQKLVKAYKDSEGDEKEKIKSRLKTLTKIKKELEMML